MDKDKFEQRYKAAGKTFVLRLEHADSDSGPNPQVKYVFYEAGDPEKPIFEGDDFWPEREYDGELNCLDEEDARVLIGFLTMQPGDTDSEYFNDYTDDQMKFAISEYAYEIRLQSIVEAIEAGPELVLTTPVS